MTGNVQYSFKISCTKVSPQAAVVQVELIRLYFVIFDIPGVYRERFIVKVYSQVANIAEYITLELFYYDMFQWVCLSRVSLKLAAISTMFNTSNQRASWSCNLYIREHKVYI